MVYNNILRLCKERGLSIGQLEIGSKVGRGIVHNWKSRSVPRVDKLKQVADYLGVSVDFLITGSDPAADGQLTVYRNGEAVAGSGFHTVRELLELVQIFTEEEKQIRVEIHV